ncbi:MAG: D-cysteine desulfhydrase [Proteobacteria bacterium]|nr:D-cysteine desulfhydrase [Pseudomonadota bacterium]
MHLARFPRRHYTPYVTPIEPLDHLSASLGGPKLWIKRDDLLGLAAGGNKTRKLEFLVADALAQGADTLITTGAVQSNHCRLTLAAAVKEGLRCRLVLEERVPDSYDPRASGNNLLFQLLGVEAVTVVPGGTDLVGAMESVVGELAAAGRRGYIIPGGGSNPLGALGYVSCAEEILAQTFELGLKIDHIVTASGSGGTHAGLVAGLHGTNAGIPVTGISVRAAREPQEERLHGLAQKAAELAGVRTAIPRDAMVVRDAYVGPGYSLPTDAMVAAVQRLAQSEGILLDPVYTGKAAAGLIDLVKSGYFGANENVLFIHTGGSPALYAYQDVLNS